MTLEEAIEHCKSVANAKCDSCGAEHRQLAKWLEELRLYREAYKKCKAVFDEMERRNEPEPYKCPDCIDLLVYEGDILFNKATGEKYTVCFADGAWRLSKGSVVGGF